MQKLQRNKHKLPQGVQKRENTKRLFVPGPLVDDIPTLVPWQIIEHARYDWQKKEEQCSLGSHKNVPSEKNATPIYDINEAKIREARMI